MTAARFLDTNILVYSVVFEANEHDKHTRAVDLLDRDDVALSVQVLQEFYLQATRMSRPQRLTHEEAVGLIARWQRFHVQDMTLAVLNDALAIKGAHRLSYWDSAIIAAARACGCHEVYSEDMAHGQRVAGVRVVNPFR